MARMPSTVLRCPVIAGPVTATLQRRRSPGTGRRELFVRCSERDCRYVDVNEPPCPLRLDLFGAEIRQSARPPTDR